jgi:Arc/MetJ-type ribon-helix-helix transcriptional regulator
MKSPLRRNLHVPLPESLDKRLRAAAKRERAPATAVARKAIEYWLEEHERAAVHEAVIAYARSVAGTAADLDEDLEAAASEHLLDDGEAKS